MMVNVFRGNVYKLIWGAMITGYKKTDKGLRNTLKTV